MLFTGLSMVRDVYKYTKGELDVIAYLQVMVRLDDCQLYPFMDRHKHVCYHSGTDIRQASFQIA